MVTYLLGSVAVPIAARAHQDGHLAGSIHDQTGGALQAVTVTVSGAASRERRSDASGRFEFNDLPPGDYDLKTAREGFEPVRRAIAFIPARRRRSL